MKPSELEQQWLEDLDRRGVFGKKCPKCGTKMRDATHSWICIKCDWYEPKSDK